jgi:hypothetical protein
MKPSSPHTDLHHVLSFARKHLYTTAGQANVRGHVLTLDSFLCHSHLSGYWGNQKGPDLEP